MKFGSTHRPTAKQCHYNGKKPDGSAKSPPQSSAPEAKKRRNGEPPKVLLAPIRHKLAFDFVGQFGRLDEKVENCQRQGVIIPESRIKAFTCAGGVLKPLKRPPDKPMGANEKSIPMVAVYPIFQDGTGGAGQTYRLVESG